MFMLNFRFLNICDSDCDITHPLHGASSDDSESNESDSDSESDSLTPSITPALEKIFGSLSVSEISILRKFQPFILGAFSAQEPNIWLQIICL